MFFFNNKQNIDTDTFSPAKVRILNVLIRDVSSNLELKEVLQRSADSIVDELNLHGCVLFLLDENKKYIFTKTISQSSQSRIALKLLKVDSFLDKLKVSLEEKNNLVVDSVISKKSNLSNDLTKFTQGVLDNSLVKIIQTATFTGTCLSLPIEYKNEIVGALLFTKRQSNYDFIKERPILEIYSTQVGIAISNAKLFTQVSDQLNQLKEKNRDLLSLYNLTTQISKSLDPEEVAQTAVNSLPQEDLMIGAILSVYERDKGEIYVHSLTQNSFSYQVQKLIGDFRKYKLIVDDPKYKENITVKAVQFENVQSSDNLSDILVPAINKQIVNLIEKILQIKSVVVYPVRARGEIIGTITYLLKSKVYTELGDNEKQLFETFTNQISIALENANLFTQQKLTQRELQRTLKELNERRRFEQDMIDVMGHELRTPMSIVRNALSFMEMEIKSKGQIALDHQKKYVQMGLEAARREVNLIETLLSATKSEGKGFQLILEKVNLVEIINNSITAHSPEAAKRNLTIKLDEDIKELYVYADKTRTQEISDNFLSNAIKYTEKGGVEIDLFTKDNHAYISVKDTGVGISEEDIKKLGQKFFRAQQYTDEEQNELNIVRPGGTGLGLFVSFSLIKVMDGNLDIQSKVGVGSTFTFGLPIYTNQERKQLSRNASEYKTDIEN